MPEILFINSSIVLVTENLMPSVTHDFLVNQKIIPKDFQVQGIPLYIPPVSQIKYNNGFNITIEPNKLQFMISKKPIPKEEEEKEALHLLMDVSKKYVNFFSDIKCKSIGINFQFIREDLQFNSLIEKTIKPDSPCLKFENHKGEVSTINVSYNNWKGKQFNVVMNKIQRIDPLPPTDVILFNINISYPSSYSPVIVEELIENFEKSQQFIKEI